MIYDVVQQNSVSESDKLCANYWIVCSLSNYAEDGQLYAKLCAYI